MSLVFMAYIGGIAKDCTSMTTRASFPTQGCSIRTTSHARTKRVELSANKQQKSQISHGWTLGTARQLIAHSSSAEADITQTISLNGLDLNPETLVRLRWLRKQTGSFIILLFYFSCFSHPTNFFLKNRLQRSLVLEFTMQWVLKLKLQ